MAARPICTATRGHRSVSPAAIQLLTSTAVADAFADRTRKPATRNRSRRHLWGQSCLLARRLVEAGTSVVTIDAALRRCRPTRSIAVATIIRTRLAAGTWKRAMRSRAPFMDQGLSATDQRYLGSRGSITKRSSSRSVNSDAARLASPRGVLGHDHWPHGPGRSPRLQQRTTNGTGDRRNNLEGRVPVSDR